MSRTNRRTQAGRFAPDLADALAKSAPNLSNEEWARAWGQYHALVSLAAAMAASACNPRRIANASARVRRAAGGER